MRQTIQHVAVVGAGTMGAAIAGLVASAGLRVTLLDVAPQELTPEEQARGLQLDDRRVRNRIVQAGFERMRKARPANLMHERDAERITLGNTSDDLQLLSDADWIIEAIVEQLEAKRELMAAIEAVRNPDSIVSSNTSGIPIHQIAQGRSENFRAHFLGTHFFNPPRYLHLLELIPTADSDPAVVATIRRFSEEVLGKGVVLAKDTPDFIGNRLGAFSALNDLAFIQEHGYTVEEVDALTGPLIGRPNTATFRLLDLAGVDIMLHVAKIIAQSLPDDESIATFQKTELLEKMVAAKRLGQKTGGGFYKEQRGEGKRSFWPLNLQTFEYEPPKKPSFPLAEEVQKIRSLPERLRFLVERAHQDPNDRAAQLIAHTILPLLAYAARRIPEISDSIVDIDNAMVWGYKHSLGPFATWDALGVPEAAELMRARGISVAPWVESMIASGATSFYKSENGQRLVYNPIKQLYEALPQDPRCISLTQLKAQGRELASNRSASVIDLGDGVLCFEFHSKGNTIDFDMMALGMQALEMLKEEQWQGMVIGHEGDDFSFGANLMMLGQPAMMGQFDELDKIVKSFQDFVMAIRFSPKPVVIAPAGRALGGGTEITLAGAHVVAAAETYLGLVEFGVGLIPAGGGCKELVRRVVSTAVPYGSVAVQEALEKVMTTIGQAKVSTSAVEARDLGYLRPDDEIVFNRSHLLGRAKQTVLRLVETGYRAPRRERCCYAVGRDGEAALKVGVYMLLQSGYATEYDAVIAARLAHVLTGGGLSAAQWVNEEYMLDLERAAFVELCKDQRTLQRAQHMLATGKPLRN
jgi:3-hydroxyacyl-CoA dehydrogenase